MSGALTMSTAAETLKGLMDHWEEALQVTIKTGYWIDTIACDRIIQEYGKLIEEALTSGKFAGDATKALE